MKDGGPAFPRFEHGIGWDARPVYDYQSGMTTRTWLAGLAMQGVLSNDALLTRLDCVDAAAFCVRWADQVLKALEPRDEYSYTQKAREVAE